VIATLWAIWLDAWCDVYLRPAMAPIQWAGWSKAVADAAMSTKVQDRLGLTR